MSVPYMYCSDNPRTTSTDMSVMKMYKFNAVGFKETTSFLTLSVLDIYAYLYRDSNPERRVYSLPTRPVCGSKLIAICFNA
jgi:hypothetical protein